MNTSRGFTLPAALLLVITLVSTGFAFPQHAPDARDYTIAAGDLRQALNQLAAESDLQIVFAPVLVAGMTTQGLTGQFTPAEALRRLLAGTGLTWDKVNGSTFVLRRMTEQETTSSTTDQQAAADGDEESSEFGEQITVTGTRIRGITPSSSPAPVITFDRAEIERLGAANVADVLDYLPQQSFSAHEQFNFAGARNIQLRGLGVGTTLVLINGRRTVTSALQGGRNFFDLNTIPLAAVERIEVLSDSASAVYGTDAVGGVVNVILKQDVTRPVVDLYYGGADGGADERRASVTFGRSGDRGRATVVLDYFDRGFLLGAERDLYADNDFRRFGGLDRRVPTTSPGNICSFTGGNLPGLPARCAAVPPGSSGLGLTPADFLATAGQTNLESSFRYSSVVPEAERHGAEVSAEYDLGDRLSAFAELLYADRDDARRSAPPALTNVVVPAENPFNPFGEPVVANFRLTSIEPLRDLSEAESLRWVAGLRGGWGTWDWELSLLGTDEDATNHRNYVLDMGRVNAALAATDPDQALNVFQDGPGGSPQLLASLTTPDPGAGRFSSSAEQGSGFLRGPLLTLPAGVVEMVVGAETRTEEVFFDSDPILVSQDRRSSSAFTEFRLPLVGAAANRRAAERLVLTLAGRYDDYDDFGGTFNPQYGLEWRPVPQLLLRGSYGTSFRAPSIFELYFPPTPFSGLTNDPRRNNEIVSYTLLTGGNPDLKPEESDSLTLGFVFAPDGPAGFQIGASYWSIEQDRRVRRLTQLEILANEDFFPDRVERAEPTPADSAAGLPGTLLSVNAVSLNFGSLETSGVDLQVSQGFATARGRFTPTLAVTWVSDYRVQDFPNTPAVDRVGVANLANGTIPEWKATAQLAWAHRGFGASAAALYTSSYDDADFLNNLTGRAVPSQTLANVAGSLDLGERWGQRSDWLDGLVLRLGVVNLFDHEPSFSAVNPIGHDPSQADVRQRFGYINLTKAF